MTGFRWNAWNIDQATKHGCSIEEIEEVVRRELTARNFRIQPNGAYLIVSRGIGGRMLEIAFVFDDPDASAKYDETVYLIHAMPLSTRKRRRKT